AGAFYLGCFMSSKTSTFHYKNFLLLDALFEGGRMFVGATSVAYLLSAGISLGQIASLKTIRAIVVLFGDLPTGALADTLGRRWSLALSTAIGGLGFTLYRAGSTWPVYVLAEALTALSLCFWSGAFEAYAIDQGALDSNPGLLDKFFHLNQALNSLAVMTFG